MKKIIYILIVFFSVSNLSKAQSVTESKESMSLGSQTSYTVEIEGANMDVTESVFKKMMKDYGKVKKNKKAKEFYAEEVKLPMVAGSDAVNLYVKFDERVNMTTATAWVDLGGSFINGDEHPKEAAGMEQFMSDLYVAVKRKAIEVEMKEAEKEENKLNKEMKKLEKKNKGYHKDIDNAKKKIEEAEANIEQNLKDQDDQRMKLAKQKEILEEIIARLNNVGKE